MSVVAAAEPYYDPYDYDVDANATHLEAPA